MPFPKQIGICFSFAFLCIPPHKMLPRSMQDLAQTAVVHMSVSPKCS